MKIGIFGGAFNPIHLGHLIAVEEMRQQLYLDKVLFVPTYKPPHKKTLTDYRHRRNMVKLAIKDNSLFELCEIEKEKQGVSWTVNTLKELHKQYPVDILYLIIGSDQYAVIRNWKEPENLVKYAKVVVMTRPGSKVPRQKQKSIIFVDISQIDIASTEIRNDMSSNKSIRYKVTEDVYEYIKKNKLYTMEEK
ncbi:MAG: nicotinate-nucleotide adenylyltransferase [Candidatus Latescibacteria bacterium]|nr:nicotinate-nucleotide adenylyltransferase [Candidatus Latescibacterota bacterium]